MCIPLGSASQKGTVMGILRSVGALARALGPVVCSSGKERQTHASIYLRNHYWKMSYLTCFMELNAR